LVLALILVLLLLLVSLLVLVLASLWSCSWSWSWSWSWCGAGANGHGGHICAANARRSKERLRGRANDRSRPPSQPLALRAPLSRLWSLQKRDNGARKATGCRDDVFRHWSVATKSANLPWNCNRRAYFQRDYRSSRFSSPRRTPVGILGVAGGTFGRETLFRGHKADKLQLRTVRTRRRDEVHGLWSGFRTGGGAVALCWSCVNPPDTAGSCTIVVVPGWQTSKGVRAGQGHEVPERDSGEVETSSAILCVALAVDRGIIQSGSRGKDFGPGCSVGRKVCKSGAMFKRSVVDDVDDSREVSQLLGDMTKGDRRQPGEGTR